MLHSPSNSSNSSVFQVTSPLPSPFNEWLESFDVKALTPRGDIPKSVPVARRSSSPLSGGISMKRQVVPIQINNAGFLVQVGMVFMSFSPPDPPGGIPFQLVIPRTWWRTQRWIKGRGFTSKHVRQALEAEVLSRLQGRDSPKTFLRKYVDELRGELETCVKSLPATAFQTELDELGLPMMPAPSQWQDWYVRYGEQRSASVQLLMQRIVGEETEVELHLTLPLAILSQSSSTVCDWLLMQISL